ncbi:hypothetical protein O9G_002069 [Rozella allomycis CSF55]|uniref:Uncharacterized protein n=1 Tax=Rozella allomycis (strain CSF55) TaxID=988480 RepID=A0A075B0Z2_ROZAC|nr:hypothetical protein O9G_002069 [Rozella allomycis CSF55]|eukprot:EPZ34496.1 hypothetical protein O9G_002069 [Rozella allomycis CSF55]
MIQRPESFPKEYETLKETLNPHLFFYTDKKEKSIKSVLEPLFKILKDFPEVFYTEIAFNCLSLFLNLQKTFTSIYKIFTLKILIESNPISFLISINPHLISILVNSGAFPLSFRLNNSFNVAQRILVSDVYNSLRNYNQVEVEEALTHPSLGMNFSPNCLNQ